VEFIIDKEKFKLRLKDATKFELRALDLWLNRHEKGYRFHPRFKMRVWDGKRHMIDKAGVVSLGLWKEIFECCQENQVPFKISNKEEFPLDRSINPTDVEQWALDFFKNHKIKSGEEWKEFIPRDYQCEAVGKLLHTRYGLTRIATSGGKSLVSAMLMFYTWTKINPNAKFLLIVPSINLVTQFYNDINEYNYGFDDGGTQNQTPLQLEIEEVMSDKPRKPVPGRNPNVCIGTYQSLAKYPKEWFEQFHGVICDEAHTCKAKTLLDIMGHTLSSAHLRIGMSGTFPGKDTSEFLVVQSVTGPIVSVVKAKNLMDKGQITPVKIKALLLNHDDAEFFERLQNIRKSDGKAAFDLEKKRAQESTNRALLVDKLVAGSKGNTLVLFHKKDYGKEMFERIKANNPDKRVYYIAGEINLAKRDHIKAQMEDTSTPAILVASYGTLSTGVSIKAITNVIFTESFKSEQIVLQSIGRALRQHKDKSVAVIFDLVDVFDAQQRKKGMLHGHYLERKKMYTEEQFPVEELAINIR
jgi:superfamily II DNA or RNA helicase